MAKEAYYFSHDANARHDEKILELRAVHGWEGYGIYWAIIESMRDADGYRYNRKRLAGLALSLGISKEQLESVLMDFDLFVDDGEFIWSERLLRTMAKKEEMSQKAKDKASKRWGEAKPEQIKIDAPAMPQHNNGTAPAMQGNKRKEKEIKDITIIPSETPEGEVVVPPPIVETVSDEGKEYAKQFKLTLPPSQKITESNLTSWASTYDLLRRIDKRPHDEIISVTAFARHDDFWQDRFLSATKLRKKNPDGVMYYDVFLTKLKNKNNGHNNGTDRRNGKHEQLVNDNTAQDEFLAELKFQLGATHRQLE